MLLNVMMGYRPKSCNSILSAYSHIRKEPGALRIPFPGPAIFLISPSMILTVLWDSCISGTGCKINIYPYCIKLSLPVPSINTLYPNVNLWMKKCSWYSSLRLPDRPNLALEINVYSAQNPKTHIFLVSRHSVSLVAIESLMSLCRSCEWISLSHQNATSTMDKVRMLGKPFLSPIVHNCIQS